MKNQVAIVTGAGKGIGLAIANQLAQDGFKVIVNDIDAVTANNAAQQLTSKGYQAHAIAADISQREQAQQLVTSAVEHYGRLDVMVNNAGLVAVAPLLEVDNQHFDKLFDVNVKGLLWCAQAAAAVMIQQGEGGRIINAGSAASHRSEALIGVYSATKFAVRTLTQTLALELAPHKINVNAYCPGIVETSMWETIDSAACSYLNAPEGTVKQSLIDRIPLGRIQTPEDVANLVSFFASEKGDYLTGQCVLTDGGLVMV